MTNTPPLSTEPLRFIVPNVISTTLADGTPLHVIPKADEDLVTIGLYLSSGSAHDIDHGATAFTAALLTRGTSSLTADEFAEAVESLGCSVRASADRTTTTMNALGMADQFDQLVAFMRDCLLEPRFDTQELETLRGRWISELLMDRVDPDWQAGQAMNRLCYPGHPYLTPRRGYMADIEQMSIEKVRTAHQRLLRSPRCVIVAGPVDPDVVNKTLSSILGDLPAPSFDPSLPQARMTERAGCIAINPDAVQTAIRIALPCVSYDHPDYPAIQLITNVLGGYTLARLFAVLREQKGYTYGAYAMNNVKLHARSTDIITSVGNNFTADTVATIEEEVRRIAQQRIDDEELENARQYLLGTFARTNETPQQTASLLWTTINHNLPRDYFSRLIERVQMYRPEELMLAQERYFDISRWSIAASGQPEVVREAIQGHVDSIETWDPLA